MAPFVGRRELLADLAGEWKRAGQGEPRLVLLEGEPGIGKSALVRSFLEETLRDEAPVVLRARAFEEERTIPHGILRQIASGAAALGDGTLAADLDAGPATPPTGSPPGTAHTRSPIELGLALLGVVGTLQSRGPVVIVVEDVQWIDEESSMTLLFLARRLARDCVLLLVTAHSGDQLLVEDGWRRIVAEEIGTRLRVEGLGIEDLQELSEGVCGRRLSPVAAKRLLDHTGGHPLYASSLLEEVGIEPFEQKVVALPAPRSLTLLVSRRLDSCGSARSFVEAASVLGESVPLGTVRALAGLSADEPAPGAGQLANLLESVPGSAGTELRFRHGLIRSAVYESIEVSRRCDLHLRAAAVLDGDPSLLHRSLAILGMNDVLASDLENRALFHVGAGNRGAAAPLFVQASTVSSWREDRDRRVVLGALSYLEAGNLPEAMALQPLVEEALPGPWRDLAIATLETFRGRMGRATDILSATWEETSGKPAFALIASLSADLLGFIALGNPAAFDAQMWGRRAQESSSGDFRLELTAAAVTAFGMGAAGDAEGGRALIEEKLGDARIAPSEITFPRLVAGLLRMWSGDLRGARNALTLLMASADPNSLFLFYLSLAEAELRLGNLDDALVRAELARAIAFEAGSVPTIIQACAMAAMCHATKGDFEEAERAAAVIDSQIPEFDREYYNDIRAEARFAIARGRGDTAAMAQAVEGISGMQAVTQPGRFVYGPVVAEARLAAGDLVGAAAVLVPFEEAVAARGNPWGAVLVGQLRGRLEAARGRVAEAVASFEASLATAIRIGARYEEGRARLALGQALARGGGPEALPHLVAARSIFQAIGAAPYLAQAEEAMAGVHGHADGEATANAETCENTGVIKRITIGGSMVEGRFVPRLTEQETVVARLAAQGMSNKAIAADLFLSVKTVEYHLSNLYAKLGVSSRTQLAARYGTALTA